MSSELQLEVARALEELAEVRSESVKMLQQQQQEQEQDQERGGGGAVSRREGGAQSSWARSSTARVGVPCRVSSQQQHLPHSSPQVVGRPDQRGFTMTRARRETGPVTKHARSTPPATTYSPQISCLSTKKRTKGFTIPQEHPPPAPRQEESKVTPPRQSAVVKTSGAPTGVHSFGKAPRVRELVVESAPISDLDVERANRYIHDHVTGGTFGKEAKMKKHNTCTDDVLKENDSQGELSAKRKRGHEERQEETANIERLSTRTRAPAPKIYNPQTKPRERLKKDRSDFGTPGPGAYYSNRNTLGGEGGRNDDPSKKCPGSFAPPSHRIPSASRVVLEMHKNKPSPGPGEYDADHPSSISKLSSTSSQGSKKITAAFGSAVGESKVTPQLLKKRYFEEKARDMREETDNLEPVNYDRVKKRTVFTARIRSESPVGITAKNQQVIRKRQAEKAAEGQGLFESAYVKVHHLTEKRVPSSVNMGQEVKAAQSTRKILEKAGIPQPETRKKLERAQGDVFLGPQLQAPWVEDRHLPPSGQGDRTDEHVNEEDEHIAEAIAIIAGSKRQEKRLTKKEADREELATAFLRSSYTGLSRRPAIAMNVPVVNPKNASRLEVDVLTKEQKNREFLSTQVHHAWGVDPSSDIAMDKATGRDKVKISKKGAILVDEFNKDVRRNFDSIGPGVYHNEDRDAFGDGPGAMVKFDSMLNRSEAIGPRGEKPPIYQDSVKMNENGYTENVNEELILDKEAAKEKLLKRTPNILLYERDRHPPPGDIDEDIANDHLGGSWFEGIATQIEKKSNSTVKYDVQKGRDFSRGGVEEDKQLLGELLDNEQEGDVWALEVTNWKPHGERTVAAPAWQDPEKQPRFEVPKIEKKPDDAPPSPTPNDRFGKPREGIGVLDMSKQPQRWTGRDFEDDVIGDEINDATATNMRADVEVAQDLDRRLADAVSKQSGRKKEVFLADFKSQSKRERTSGIKSEAPDVEYEVTEGVQGREQRRDIGVLDWDKQQGRDLNVIDKNRVMKGKNAENEEQYISDEEELDMEALPNKAVLSNVKRTVYLPAWSEAKGPTRPEEKPTLGAHLEYSPDADFGKPGPAKTVGMNKTSGRNDNKSLRDVGDIEHDLAEELDLNVDMTVKEGLKFADTGGAPSWNKGAATDNKYNGKIDEIDEPEELILRPRKSDWSEPSDLKGQKSRKDMLGRGDVRPGDREKGFDSSVMQTEELILDPINVNLKENNVQPSWSKKSEDKKSVKLPGEIDETEELKLDPRRPSDNTNRATVSWSKTSDDGRNSLNTTRNGGKVENDEELILSPKDPREVNIVQSASWQKQSNDATREMGRDKMLNDDEELILSPKESRRNQRKPTDWSKLSDQKEPVRIEPSEELKLSPKEVKKNPVSSSFINADALNPRGGTLATSSMSEELKLSPRDVTKKRASIPNAPPTITKKDKDKAIRDRKQTENAVLKEKLDKQKLDADGGSGQHHKEASVTWKDEVPGGDHRLTEGSPHAPQGTSKSKRRASMDKRRAESHKPKSTNVKEPSKRVQSSVSRAFTALEEPSPPTIKAPTPVSHVPEGFGKPPSKVKHFKSNVSQAYDNIDQTSPHEVMSSKPPATRKSDKTTTSLTEKVSNMMLAD